MSRVIDSAWPKFDVVSTSSMPSCALKLQSSPSTGSPMVPVPTGVMQFKGDVWNLPRKWADRVYNVQSWKVEEKGGHFAPAEKPDLIVSDLREFFRRFR